jgi:hypothetical protein
MRRFLFVLLLCLTVPAAPAAAQCRLCSSEGGTLTSEEAAAVPVRLEVETSLDFDSLVLTGSAGGMARLGADGSRLTSGAVEALSPRAMSGELLIRGEPGRAVRVSMPQRIELVGSTGGSLTIQDLASDLPSSPRLDRDGRLRVRFGGELLVSGDAEGDYRGDIAITVEYL